MADTNAQADIRGIDIDKLAKGFADEEIKLKRFVTNSNTSAREIRWYQKTSGFLNSVSTTGITASQIANTDFKSRPVVVEQSWTKNTSYVRKYFVESPWISDEDIRDTDIDILATNVRDLVRAVEHQVDLRIWSIISNGQSGVGINTNATTAPWDTASFTNVDIIEDLMEAKMNIRVDGYDPEGAILLVNSYDHKQILTWLISNKGSSIPAFASQKIETGVVMELLGLKVVVDENVTAGYALVFVNQRAATWKSFVPLTSVTIEDKGIGTKIRIWEEGECILTDPNAVNLITNTRT
jgi:hypothetical protein